MRELDFPGLEQTQRFAQRLPRIGRLQVALHDLFGLKVQIKGVEITRGRLFDRRFLIGRKLGL